MIDFHTHTLLSDGELLPSELVRRAAVKGYTAMAITDHLDISNLDLVPKLVKACRELNGRHGITVLPGVEITHAPPEHLPRLVRAARKGGCALVNVHGETINEPVRPGTNHAALLCDIDILVHPGLITFEDAKLAARRGIYLEITSRKGHSYTNGHVAAMAKRAGAKLVINSDSHAPEDLLTDELARAIARGAGLSDAEVDTAFQNSRDIVRRKTGRRRS